MNRLNRNPFITFFSIVTGEGHIDLVANNTKKKEEDNTATTTTTENKEPETKQISITPGTYPVRK